MPDEGKEEKEQNRAVTNVLKIIYLQAHNPGT